MKKILLSIGLVSLLSGCVIDTYGCFSGIEGGWTCPHGFHRSDFDAYTKADENKTQKLKDVADCGGEINQYGTIFNLIRERAKKNREDEFWAVRNFGQCMRNKGYVFYDD